MVGQDEAISACVDVVSVAKARLNDPHQPLATMIFLGPTGVGKTQCAKGLAQYLFGDKDRLVRFDMNEYVSPFAAARLVGTFDEPEGLLTSVIRQRPFSVILLDEIEKAHPDVFDMLLQVTGEGRLTDGLGRTAHFNNAIIIMTSNLGVADTSKTIGFRPSEHRQAFLKAAENFFRPEFLNRIDRIVPFQRLSREHIRDIAALEMQEVFAREGMVRRRCVLSVDEAAMERVINEGYHPQLGARALKRSIERTLTQTVSQQLSSVITDQPTIIRVVSENAGIGVHVEPLEAVEPVPQLDPTLSGEALATRTLQLVKRVTESIEKDRSLGTITAGSLTPEQIRYFAIQEQATKVRELAESFFERQRMSREQIGQPAVAPKARRRQATRALYSTYRDVSEKRMLRELISATDVNAFVKEHTSPGSELDATTLEMVGEAKLLHAMVNDRGGDRVLIAFQPLGKETHPGRIMVIKTLTWRSAFDLTTEALSSSPRILGLSVSGVFAEQITSRDVGIHLCYGDEGTLAPVVVHSRRLSAEDDAEESWQQWRRELESQSKLPSHHVVRVYEANGPIVDLRSGLTRPSTPNPEGMKDFLLAGLPLPPELSTPDSNNDSTPTNT